MSRASMSQQESACVGMVSQQDACRTSPPMTSFRSSDEVMLTSAPCVPQPAALAFSQRKGSCAYTCSHGSNPAPPPVGPAATETGVLNNTRSWWQWEPQWGAAV